MRAISRRTGFYSALSMAIAFVFSYAGSGDHRVARLGVSRFGWDVKMRTLDHSIDA